MYFPPLRFLQNTVVDNVVLRKVNKHHWILSMKNLNQVCCTNIFLVDLIFSSTWNLLLLMIHSLSFTAVPSAVWEGHGGMMLKRIMGRKSQGKDGHLTGVWMSVSKQLFYLVFFCCNCRHWIAVFSHVFQRDSDAYIELLMKWSRQPNTGWHSVLSVAPVYISSSDTPLPNDIDIAFCSHVCRTEAWTFCLLCFCFHLIF